MPKTKLTQPFVDSASCPTGKQKIDYFDTDIPGLLLKAMPTGKRTYYVRYKDPHGKMKERRLHDASVVSLGDARQQAKQVLSKIELGQDPFAEKRLKREVPTLNAFIHDTYLPYLKAAKKSWQLDEAQLRLHVQPSIGKLYMDDIKFHHVNQLFIAHNKVHKPASTNRMLNVLHRLFVCAMDWETPGVSQNPVSKIKKLKENNQRDRYLSEEELSKLWKVLDDLSCTVHGYLFKFLILTGARKNEVTKCRWCDIEIQGKQWRIPENKSGKVRYVPLSEHAIGILQSIDRHASCDYVFPNPETMKPYINLFHAWNSIRQDAGIPDVRIHDLRHSYASYLVNNGTPIYEVKELLGHSNVSTTQRYAHLSNVKLLNSTNIVGNYVHQATAIVVNGNHNCSMVEHLD
nr:site-specific integrase [Halomonas socia]